MARRKSKVDKFLADQDEASYELDLSPMLALMVTLIPVMLLASVFVKITIIESSIPQVIQNAIQEDRDKTKRDVSIHLAMNKDKSFNLDLLVNNRRSKRINIKKMNETWDLNKLHSALVDYKLQNPNIFRVDLFPSENVSYDDIVKVMDEARNTKPGDPKVFIKDKETNKKIETKVMFPDMVFSNVVEG